LSVVFMMPKGARSPRPFEFKIVTTRHPNSSLLRVCEKSIGQYEVTDNDVPVLSYKYRTVEPGEVAGKVSEANRIYARARSDYIHPLFGLDGEELTRDWSLDHPHHRGIYWAWPEVDYGPERGDLHALQKLFARPTGRLRVQSGPVFAEIEAENDWLWEDREPIVRETATIRVYRVNGRGRYIDLALKFVGLEPGVAIARRGTDKYGGLNIRMATPEAQVISVLPESAGRPSRLAWSDLSGIFAGNARRSGLAVLQHAGNPEYPGDWIQYPELSWCQPTFPTAGSRYPLTIGKQLVLRYRLWVHSGADPVPELFTRVWDAFHDGQAARL